MNGSSSNSKDTTPPDGAAFPEDKAGADAQAAAEAQAAANAKAAADVEKAAEAQASPQPGATTSITHDPRAARRSKATSSGAANNHPLSEDAMLNFYLSTIAVRTGYYELVAESDVKREGLLLDEVKAGLDCFMGKFEQKWPGDKNSAWNEAYRLERILALAEPTHTLVGEVQRRLEEAADEGVSSASRLRARFENTAKENLDTSDSPPTFKPGGEQVFRALLLDIVEETQYHMARAHSILPLKKSVAYRTACALALAC